MMKQQGSHSCRRCRRLSKTLEVEANCKFNSEQACKEGRQVHGYKNLAAALQVAPPCRQASERSTYSTPLIPCFSRRGPFSYYDQNTSLQLRPLAFTQARPDRSTQPCQPVRHSLSRRKHGFGRGERTSFPLISLWSYFSRRRLPPFARVRRDSAYCSSYNPFPVFVLGKLVANKVVTNSTDDLWCITNDV